MREAHDEVYRNKLMPWDGMGLPVGWPITWGASHPLLGAMYYSRQVTSRPLVVGETTPATLPRASPHFKNRLREAGRPECIVQPLTTCSAPIALFNLTFGTQCLALQTPGLVCCRAFAVFIGVLVNARAKTEIGLA